MSRTPNRTKGFFLLASAAVVALATLGPAPPSASLPFWCFRCGDRIVADVLLNVLLFMPFGAALGAIGVPRKYAIPLIVLTTTAIELLQYTVIPGRFASFRDIVSNTIGGVVGWELARHWKSFVAPSPRGALVLASTTATLWLGVQMVTAWSLLIVLPPVPWWAQIKLHDRDFQDVFAGDVVSTSVGAVPIGYSDQLNESSLVRQEIQRGAPLQTTVTNVGRLPNAAPIIALAKDDKVGEIMALLQIGSDVAFRVRTRGASIGLRSPAIRLANVFGPGMPGDTVRIAASYGAHTYRLRAVRGSTRLERVLAPSASWGWVLLMPWPHHTLGEEVRWLTALWLFVPVGLLAIWCSRYICLTVRHSTSAFVLALSIVATVTVLALAVVPIVFRVPISHWSEWLAAMAAALGGVLAERAMRRTWGLRV